ncbi:hypothetical protein vBRpoSV10_154 [Ruegeria phage vB_RpoS-V10]|nr:hypothetical protein vBRpoSV10_154 [Ruegeria phage vB_RpoS-V10]
MSGGKIIAVWPVLFNKAAAMGKARIAYTANPSEENEQILSDLEADHAAYEELCLRADEMIGLPDFQDVMHQTRSH